MRSSLALGMAWLVCACATPDGRKPARIEVAPDGGFTITEQARFSTAVREDFQSAVRLVAQDEYAGGIALLEKVTEAAPSATAAHIDLGIAYRLERRYEQAEASFRRALELNPSHPVAHNELGIVYRRMGRFAEARRSYESALQILPEFHHARRNLAILCDVYIDDLPCALENYERYAQVVPEDEQVGMWIADLRNRKEK